MKINIQVITALILSYNLSTAQERVFLPQENVIKELSLDSQQALDQSERWSRLKKEGWTAVWNETLKTPHRAWGKPLKIAGFTSIHENNVLAAAETFLDEYGDALSITFQSSRTLRAYHSRNTWFVTLQQYHADLPVLFSRIELRISDDAHVSLFGVDYFNDINLPEVADLDENTLTTKAGFTKDSKIMDYAILPIISATGTSYHKVARVSKGDHGQDYYDTKTGELIWQRSTICNAFSGNASGLVQETLTTDSPTELAFKNLFYKINDEEFLTGQNGEFEIDIQETADLLAQLRGPYVVVNNKSQSSARIQTTVEPDEDVIIRWDDTNSTKSERNAFYHINVAHDTLKAMDPAYTFLDYSLPVNVNRSPAGCNAFYNQTSINFDSEGAGCASGADIAMVVYHEYGHAIIDKLFIEMGFPGGYVNRAADEAQADVFSTMIENSSVFAPGFFGPGTSTRNLTTFRKFPTGVDLSSPHQTGLILSGAFWDLKSRTSPELVNRLAHFAKYGAPDDADVGTVFRDWFIEVLVADDDDNDLSNGTPHFADIDWAFKRHGINVPGIIKNPNVTGIEDELDFSVFPNPNVGSFEIDLRGISEPFELIVRDISGREMFSISSNDIPQKRFPFNWYETGMLLVSVKSKGNMQTKKVVIN